MAVLAATAMVVHHAAVLASPIERYDRSWWVVFVTGPVFELALGIAAAVLAAWISRRGERRAGATQNPSVTAAAGRDPVLFAVSAADDASSLVRLGAAVVPVVLLAVIVIRVVWS